MPIPHPWAAVTPTPDWQCVLILWGDKYGAAEVDHIAAAVRAHARTPPRMVVLTDRPRPGLAPGVEERPIPPFYLQPGFRGGGCLSKLALFEPGVLRGDLPTVYLDLDTVVLGDLSRALAALDRPGRIALLPASLLGLGRVSRLIWRLSGGRWHARGNSSVMVFRPADCHGIAARFRAELARGDPARHRWLRADDRFLSWAVQPRLRRLPREVAAKLPGEFMLRPLWLLRWRSRLPWVRRRWAGLAAISLPGDLVKPERLLALPEGAVVTDRRGRHLVWTDAAMGVTRGRLIAHARALSAARAAAPGGTAA